MTQFETVIGLEVHVQLLTESKMFCGCSAAYAAAPPNTHVCPVCMALPGVLPVINEEAVAKTLMTGLALHCTIAAEAVFARKNYHYPDLPKGYQISQYELPLCKGGWLEIEPELQPQSTGRGKASDQGAASPSEDGPAGRPSGSFDGPRRIGITRAHLEEDTGKLMHVGGYSLIDLNRAGVPLLEIVSDPDLRSAEEARAYLVKLQSILRYLGVSHADMEKGAMRCEANVSIRPVGQPQLGTKVEIKNLNSFRAVKQALEYEVARQARLIEAGESVLQVTMGWDDEHGRTFVQRVKETSDDYRYFPEPDLPPLAPDPAWVAELAAALPELPDAKAARFVAELGLDPRDARVLVAEREVADYFEATVDAARDQEPRVVANWIGGELFRLMNLRGGGIDQLPITPRNLAELLSLISSGQINQNSAKRALEVMFDTGRRAPSVVQELGMAQVSDSAALESVVERVLARHPQEVEKYHAGKGTMFEWLMGQVMRETRGKANPGVARELLKTKLDG